MDSQKTLFILAGINGAGKSTFADHSSQYAEIINPDRIAKGIENANPDFSFQEIWKNTFKEINDKIDSKFEKGENVAFETTFAGNAANRRMQQALEKGYKVQIDFIALDSKERHYERVEYRVSQGGHDIPRKDIDRRFETVYKKLPDIMEKADGVTVWDNSTLNAYEKVLEVEKGRITFIDKEKIPQPVRDALKETKLEIGQRIQSNFEEKEVKFMNMKTFEESTRKVRMPKGLTPEQRESFVRENVIAKDDRLSKVNSKDLKICIKEAKSLDLRKGMDLNK